MPLYTDDEGHLYWHDSIAAVLEPVPPSEQRAAHGIWPTIARIRPERAGWLGPGSLGLMATGLVMAGLSVPLAQADWPLGLGLAVLGFLWTAWTAIYFVPGICARRVRFERPLTLMPKQPLGPYLMGLAMALSLGGPAYALFWKPGLDVMGGAGRSVLAMLLLAWLVWRQVRRWWRVRRAIRAAAANPPTP